MVHLHDTTITDSLRNSYANYSYNLFQEMKESTYRLKAGIYAFSYWKQTGNIDAVEEAMADLPPDSKLWVRIIEDIPDAYNVTWIPWTYVINRKGEIVAKRLRGENLENKVSETVLLL